MPTAPPLARLGTVLGIPKATCRRLPIVLLEASRGSQCAAVAVEQASFNEHGGDRGKERFKVEFSTLNEVADSQGVGRNLITSVHINYGSRCSVEATEEGGKGRSQTGAAPGKIWEKNLEKKLKFCARGVHMYKHPRVRIQRSTNPIPISTFAIQHGPRFGPLFLS